MLSKKAFGIPGVLAVLYVGVTAMLDIKDRRADPGMLGDFARFLADPPPAFVLFALGMGLWLLWVYQYNGIEEVREEFRQRRLSKNQAFAEELLDLWQRGVHDVLNDPGIQRAAGTGGDEDFILWTMNTHGWVEDVLALMLAHPCTKEEVVDVQTLGDVPPGCYHTHPGINGYLSNEAERLRRIRSVARRYAKGNMPMPPGPHT